MRPKGHLGGYRPFFLTTASQMPPESPHTHDTFMKAIATPKQQRFRGMLSQNHNETGPHLKDLVLANFSTLMHLQCNPEVRVTLPYLEATSVMPTPRMQSMPHWHECISPVKNPPLPVGAHMQHIGAASKACGQICSLVSAKAIGG